MTAATTPGAALRAAGRQRLGGENFPVALAVLPRRIRAHLQAVYRFARHVDDVGDEYAGDRTAALEGIRADLHRLYAGLPASEPAVEGLRPTVAACRVPIDPWLRLVEANIVDQQVTRYETFDDLVGYCRLSADPVGEVVLYIFGRATTDRIALSNRICTGLQLLEHWQDVGEDFRRGRVYLPQADLRRFGAKESDLGLATASAELRALLAFETSRALAWIDAGSPLVSTLSGWGRLAVSGYVAGGRAAARALRRADHDPLPAPPKPGGRQVLAAWLEASVRWPG